MIRIIIRFLKNFDFFDILIFFAICLLIIGSIGAFSSALKTTRKDNSEIFKIKKCNLLIKDYTTEKSTYQCEDGKKYIVYTKIIENYIDK